MRLLQSCVVIVLETRPMCICIVRAMSGGGGVLALLFKVVFRRKINSYDIILTRYYYRSYYQHANTNETIDVDVCMTVHH